MLVGIASLAQPEFPRAWNTSEPLPLFESYEATTQDARPVNEDRFEVPDDTRDWIGRVNVTLLDGAREEIENGRRTALALDPIGDPPLVAVLERVEETPSGYSMSGHVAGSALSSVVIVVRGGIVAASIHSNRGAWIVHRDGAGAYRIARQADALLCGVDARRPAGASARLRARSGASASDTDDEDIDLLVVYTAAARRRDGGYKAILTNIDLAVAAANEAYRQSGVEQRLNLVAAVEIAYVESSIYPGGLTNQGVDLRRLTEPDDGVLDEVLVLRDNLAADVVHLLVDQPGGGGKGNIPDYDGESAGELAMAVSNSVADTVSGSGTALFTHELGHVMGLLHDRYVDPRNAGAYSYSHGYVNQRAFEPGAPSTSEWRTVMAYAEQCRDNLGRFCPQLLRFSNPDQTHPDEDGDPLGVPGDFETDAVDGPANAALSLNGTRAVVAGFRDSAERCQYGVSLTEVTVDAEGGEFTVDVEDPDGCGWDSWTTAPYLAVSEQNDGDGAGIVSVHVQANTGPARIGAVVAAGQTVMVRQRGHEPLFSVCDRTRQVRDVIMDALDQADCGGITEFDLLDITRLDLALKNIIGLDVEDFRGLSNVTYLDLGANSLVDLPDGVFGDLVQLSELRLDRNALTALGDRTLDGLRNIRNLNVRVNDISDISSGAFSRLPELETVNLSHNALSSLPRDVFSGLTKLRYLYIGGNPLHGLTLHREHFRDLWLIRLGLQWMSLGELPGDVFQDVANIGAFHLDDAGLTALPDELFAGLRPWQIDLSGNELTRLSGGVIPGSALQILDLSRNRLDEVPAGIFEGFTSAFCFNRSLQLDLSGNPGAPFALTVNAVRTDAPPGASGPATVVMEVEEGVPLPLGVDLRSEGAVSLAPPNAVSIPVGARRSTSFEIDGEGAVTIAASGAGDLPPNYRGLRLELGEGLRLFTLEDRSLALGRPLALDLDEILGKEGVAYSYSAVSADGAVVSVRVDGATLVVEPEGEGSATVTVSATGPDGTQTIRSFDVTVSGAIIEDLRIPYIAGGADTAVRHGFVRLINHSGADGQVSIEAYDDSGSLSGPLTLDLGAGSVVHFNTDDLENGNPDKGLSTGVGIGQGAWRLEPVSDLDIEALSYMRTTDGFLTSMHDTAPVVDGVHRVAIFNPASNVTQVSRLRLVNPSDRDVAVTIVGTDDTGASEGIVILTLPARGAKVMTAADLEGGVGVIGALGDGVGKWRLTVSADEPIHVMSLLESPGGYLTNLSTIPAGDGSAYLVPLFPAASDAMERQGFVRVVNHGNTEAEVAIVARDGTDRDYENMTLSVGPNAAAHFNSDDLEAGSPAKGLTGRTGPGEGDWHLELRSVAHIEVMSYIRMSDGFLTSMHDVASRLGDRQRLAVFNPGRNRQQVSRLRLINRGPDPEEVTIRGWDDSGDERGPLRATVGAGRAVSFTAAELEEGAPGLVGELGQGVGKWRLVVESDGNVTALGVLESPTGHLTNLSTAPGRW